MEGGGDERFSRAGRRVQDDVTPAVQFEDRFLLFRVQLQASRRNGAEKTREHVVRRGRTGQGREWGSGDRRHSGTRAQRIQMESTRSAGRGILPAVRFAKSLVYVACAISRASF